MKKKKWLSLLLAAAMLLSLCPASFAAESAGDAAENPSSDAAGAENGTASGSGNYEYVIPMEHESVFWDEAAERFLTRDDSKMTLYNTEGRRLTDAYDSLSYREDSGTWLASDGRKRMILDNDGKIQGSFELPEDRFIVDQANGIVVMADLSEEEGNDFWWRTYTGDMYIYDYAGNLLGSFPYQEYPSAWQLVNSCTVTFENGLYIFSRDGKKGALDTSGEVAIEPQFDWIENFYPDNGYAVASKDGKYGIIDKNGNTIVDFVYDSIGTKNDDDGTFYIIEQDGKWGIMDESCRIVKEPCFSGFDVSTVYPEEGLVKIREEQEGTSDGLYGLMTTDGKILLDCLYYDISDPSGGRIAVAEDYDRWAFFDFEGNQITDFIYQDTGDFSEGLAFVREADRSGFIDQNGTFLFSVDAGSIYNVKTVYFSEGLAPVSNTQGGAFYVDKTGRTVLSASAEEDWRSIQVMHDGMAIVSSAAVMHPGSTGVIRYTGPELPDYIPPQDPEPADPTDPGDVPSGWATDEVNEAIALNIVPESLQSRYQSPVTRAEFCELACSLLTAEGIELPEENSENPNPFTDSDSRYVYSLSRLGVIDGRGNGIFDPDAAITRQEAAKLLANTAGVMGLPHTEVYYDYSDAEEADEWAQPFIQEVSNLGVMLGVSEGVFDPQGTYTREQSVITMLRLYHC